MGPVHIKPIWELFCTKQWPLKIVNVCVQTWLYKPLRLLDGSDKVKYITFCILQEAGHVVQMDSSRIPTYVLEGKFHEGRPVGRPRLR